jgi:chromatin segregation and condensation protein Rec8/ScpA/Scc1 (kleisin family)
MKKIQNRKTTERIKEPNWFLEKINEMDRFLRYINMKKRKKSKFSKTRNESRDVTTHITEIKRVIREYFGEFQDGG